MSVPVLPIEWKGFATVLSQRNLGPRACSRWRRVSARRSPFTRGGGRNSCSR